MYHSIHRPIRVGLYDGVRFFFSAATQNVFIEPDEISAESDENYSSTQLHISDAKYAHFSSRQERRNRLERVT